MADGTDEPDDNDPGQQVARVRAFRKRDTEAGDGGPLPASRGPLIRWLGMAAAVVTLAAVGLAVLWQGWLPRAISPEPAPDADPSPSPSTDPSPGTTGTHHAADAGGQSCGSGGCSQSGQGCRTSGNGCGSSGNGSGSGSGCGSGSGGSGGSCGSSGSNWVHLPLAELTHLAAHLPAGLVHRRPNPAARLATAAIRWYQRHLSPRRPARCRYAPSCSRYGLAAIERYGLLTGATFAVARIRRCTPAIPPNTPDPLTP